MDIAGIICLIIFVGTLLVILLGRLDETAVALFSLGLCALVLYTFNNIAFTAMLGSIYWDTVLFIAAMMIIISVLGSSGMFQYMALVLARWTRGEPRRLFMVLMGFVFVVSLVLQPLPTILIIGAFTAEVCNSLGIDFRPYLLSEAVVANSASIPSPIGSIPNMIVVSLTEMNIGLMFVTLFPLSLLLLGVTIWYFLRYYRQVFAQLPGAAASHLFDIEPRLMIRSRLDFFVSAIALAVLITGLVLVPTESVTVALVVAGGLLVISFQRAKVLLNQLSWNTVFFIVGLFGIVAALQVTGVSTDLVAAMTAVVGNNVFIAILVMIWLPGFVMSAFDTIPIAAFLAPMSVEFASLNRIVPISMVAGLNFSVYVIPFGDAPNMYLRDLAEKNRGPISWMDFTKAVTPLGLVHLAISTAYLFAVAALV
ncbi:MAG: hypothetical protein C4K47_04045 [Candidatus Thorarchaeota archaeon]|nr:MAG: hypothetical protein C4K47_04045 [Candidatus Thorarchaeota archaeon]